MGRTDPGTTALVDLASDRHSGATALTQKALGIVARSAGRLKGFSELEQRARVREWGLALATMQPAMGALVVSGLQLQRLARVGSRRHVRPDVIAWSRAAMRELDRELPGVVRIGRKYFPPHAEVVTISRSETVIRLLTALSGPSTPKRVTVLRSRPGGEGAQASRALRARGVQARCVEDRRVDEVVGQADLVLAGADTVFADGAILHKVGTRPLCESAQRWHVPVVVAVGVSKLAPWRGPPPERLPPLFDRTPARLIQEYWTDRGRWGRRDVVAEARRPGKRGKAVPPLSRGQ
jgi:ribose 1,5-bisphosphate isomerase